MQPSDQRDFDLRVEQAIIDLDRVARGENAHYHMSCTLDWLRCFAARLSMCPATEQGDRLRSAFHVIRANLDQMFTDVEKTRLAYQGLEAACRLIDKWTIDSPADDPQAVSTSELLAHARILQNICHNESLIAGMSGTDTEPTAKTGAPTNNARTARRLAALALSSLSVALGSEDPLVRSMQGISLICEAAEIAPDLPNMVADLEPDASAIAKRLAPILAERTETKITPETVFQGLGGAVGLFTLSTEFRIDQHAYARILKAELEALYFNELLASRGHPLEKRISEMRAWDHSAPSGALQ